MKLKLVSLIVGLGITCLTGCSNSSHEHTFDMNKWNYDSEFHWHPSTCSHDVVSSKSKHIYKETIVSSTHQAEGYTLNECTICGFSVKTKYTPILADTYTVTWLNWNGEVLETDQNVEYGTKPSFDGSTPTRNDDEQYSYSFIGWSPEITDVIGNVTYTAQYEGTIKTYTITFQNFDGTFLSSVNVKYGESANYSGTTPVRETEPSCLYYYSFNGWSCASDLDFVTKDDVATASYSKVIKSIYSDFSAVEVDGKLFLSQYSGSEKDIVIPDGFDGVFVNGLPTDITNISIPKSVSEIYGSEMSRFLFLTEYNAGKYDEKDVFLYYNSPFRDFDKLKGFVVSSDNAVFASKEGLLYSKDFKKLYSCPRAYEASSLYFDSNLKIVCRDAVFYNENVLEIDLNNTVTYIGEGAFANCFNLVSVKNALSVVYIKLGAFSNDELLEEALFGDALKEIGDDAFYSKKLTSFYIGKNVELIGRNPFSCISSSLTTFIVSSENTKFFTDSKAIYTIDKKTLIAFAPKSCTSYTVDENTETIGFRAFYYADSLTSLILPPNLKTIDYGGLTGIGCSSILLPETLTSIGREGFWQSRLQNLFIPKNVSFIGPDCFAGNYKMESFVVDDENETYASLDGVLFDKELKNLIAFPSKSGIKNYVIPQSVEIISGYAFCSVYDFESITLQTNIKTISPLAFLNIWNLEYVIYSGTKEQWNLIEIYDTSFRNCDIQFIWCNDQKVYL